MPLLPDREARSRIAGDLGNTLFVSAGAGSGKTRALVGRIVETVLADTDPVPVQHIAAVTFTEKAAAELRDRLRGAFERQHVNAASQARRSRAAEALDDLDQAAIGTLHSFAQRILTDHPIQAGLPPLVEVLDEVASGVVEDERWTALRSELLDDPDLEQALPLLLAAGGTLDGLRSMYGAFTANWDLLTDRLLAQPVTPPSTIRIDRYVAEAERLAGHATMCRDGEDKFLPRLAALRAWADRLSAAIDDTTRLAVLGEASGLKWHHGSTKMWTCDLRALREECKQLVHDVDNLRRSVSDTALRRVAQRIARATLDAAQARRDEGRLEFHDLLVLARDLLRHPDHGATVRQALHDRYQRLLLDEFQDTDPIQVELAVRIAAGADATAADWEQVPVPDGSLFVVGDPKQSIYRFRRADIATYLRARELLGNEVILNTNFRTGAPALDWINFTFERLIQEEAHSQPEYEALQPHRPGPPGPSGVCTIGDEHAERVNADQLRQSEANDVVAAVATMLAERWQVDDGNGGWRDVRLADIAVLVPARTSVPYLEIAFDAAGIGYHAEASSLVYRTRAIRDLLMAAKAADDPADRLALVSALHSELFGCGDDDLWTWQQAGGRWNILAPPPDGVDPGHPVALGIAYLRDLNNDRTWLPPSEVLTRLVDERRMFEVATDAPRPRDVWRRLRFVIDQARAWSDTAHGSLRAYLAWATRQGAESARVAEAVLPETDAETLRILTIHAAKGLEFPVVILTGLTSRPGGRRAGVEVLWTRQGGCEVKLSKDLQTQEYEAEKPLDEQMGHHERLRLLYVACTRARDHLVVSLHRNPRTAGKQPVSEENLTSAELLARGCDGAPYMRPLSPVEHGDQTRPVLASRERPVAAPSPFAQWHATMLKIRSAAARPAAVAASHLEGAAGRTARTATFDQLGEPVDPGLAKQARDLELPPWNKGRYGTAVGRAVHGVLQSVDLSTGAGLLDAVAAQALAEGVTQYTEQIMVLARHALNSDVVRRAAGLPHWRETYAATTVDGRILEGIIDLLYRDDDGLVIVDYKTDAVPGWALPARVDFYRPQLAAYAAAVTAATDEPVTRCVLLFLTMDGVHARDVDGRDSAISTVRELVTAME